MGVYTKTREKIRNLYRLNKIKAKYRISSKDVKINSPSIEIKKSDKILTSIIISFNDNIDITVKCIKSIYNAISETNFEIIVINNRNINITDFPETYGIKLINLDNQLGFVKSINLAISQAKGKYIYLLSAYTHVHNGFLDELLNVFNSFENVGTVGSMLLNTNGSLKEAGSFYLSDHLTHRVSKETIYSPEVNYIYQVDYSTYCSILFEKINNTGQFNFLDENYNTETHSITDLCFRLKHSENKKNYFTPFSKVTKIDIINEYKFFTSNKLNKSIAQEHEYFQNKWKNILNTIKSKTVWERIQELYHNNGIIFFHFKIPQPDNNSGDLRLSEIIKTYASVGYHCSIVAPTNKINNSYNDRLQRLGVRVYYDYRLFRNYQCFFKKLLKNKNQIWLSMSEIFLKFNNSIQENFSDSTIIFDMVDVHHLRYERALQVSPNNTEYKKLYKKFLRLEMEASQKADIVITISEDEKNYMNTFTDISKLLVISNIHYSKVKLNSIPSFNQRKNLLFIGSSHHPNIDAINFLIEEVMPLVWKINPSINLNVVGDVNKYFKNINNERVKFWGFVPNIENFFLENRIMVAPLRYGAGVKGKIGQAFEYYLPVVTSTIGAEGMFLSHEKNALLADNANQFAKEILRLYNNEELWYHIQQNIDASLKPFSIENLIQSIKNIESIKK